MLSCRRSCESLHRWVTVVRSGSVESSCTVWVHVCVKSVCAPLCQNNAPLSLSTHVPRSMCVCVCVWRSSSVKVYGCEGVWQRQHVCVWMCVCDSCLSLFTVHYRANTGSVFHMLALSLSLSLTLSLRLSLKSISLNPPLCSFFSLPSLLPLRHSNPSFNVCESKSPPPQSPPFSSSPLCRTGPGWVGPGWGATPHPHTLPLLHLTPPSPQWCCLKETN